MFYSSAGFTFQSQTLRRMGDYFLQRLVQHVQIYPREVYGSRSMGRVFFRTD